MGKTHICSGVGGPGQTWAAFSERLRPPESDSGAEGEVDATKAWVSAVPLLGCTREFVELRVEMLRTPLFGRIGKS